MSLDIRKLLILKKLSPFAYIKVNNQSKKPLTELLEEYQKNTTKLIEQIKTNFINKMKPSVTATFDALPIGTITLFAGLTIPEAWLVCDGSSLLITDYLELFNNISTIYGGDGQNNFMLPNFKGKTAIGSINNLGNYGGQESITLNIDHLPSHNHSGNTNITGNHNHSGNTSTIGDHIHTTNSNSDQYNEYGLIHKSYGGNNTINNLYLHENIGGPDIVTAPLHIDVYAAGAHKHTIQNDGDHNHSFITDNIGSNLPFNIMQPYLTINYLIKYK